MEKKNTIKVYTTSSGAELNISSPDMKQVINATNNRAQYFAELAKKYKEEAKFHSDNAKYYAEQNSDVTFEYIDGVKVDLERQIGEKQNIGDCVLREELTNMVNDINNSAELINKTQLMEEITKVELPSQEGCAGKVLVSDGENEYWSGINSFNLFDTKLSDHVLTGDEALGWALQGTYASKAIYPDFYAKCLEEKESATATEVTLSGTTITMYLNANGHQFYDIADKSAVDSFFTAMGSAWFYGIDTENERVFLPRNNYFEQVTVNTTEVGKSIEAGLPTHTHTFTRPRGDQNYANGGGNTWWGATNGITVTTSTPNNSIYGKSNTVQPNAVKKLLYICVGNTTVNETLVDVGNLSSQLNLLDAEKVNTDLSNCTKPYIIDSYVSGYSWYRVWSDGFCEQGGRTSSVAGGNYVTVTLLKPYKNTNYTISLSSWGSYTAIGEANDSITSRTTEGFYINSGYAAAQNKSWRTAGFVNLGG